MNCPVCAKEMTEEDYGDVKIDICKNGCKGMWFDWSELGRVDEKNEKLAEALEDVLDSPRINDENRALLKCPRCGVNMHAHRYKAAKRVNIDECYHCGGFFLDSGELKTIRDMHMSKQEQEEYAQRLIQGIPEYRHFARNQERSAAIQIFAKFLTHKYYKF